MADRHPPTKKKTTSHPPPRHVRHEAHDERHEHSPKEPPMNDDQPEQQHPDYIPPTVQRPSESALPPGYRPQEYPKMKYHEDGRTKTVENELDEDTAEGDGFTLDGPPTPKVEPVSPEK